MKVNHGANLYDLSSQYGFSKEDFEITPEEHQKIMRKHIQYQFDMIDLLYKIINSNKE